MKVLLLGDASNYHRCLAVGLRRLGHDVTVASDGSRWMDTQRDINLSRRDGRIGGAMLWLKLSTVLSSQLKGYDVVHINNPFFIRLRPPRLRTLFNRLRRDNGGVFLTALGTDPQYIDMCRAVDNPLRYTEYNIGRQPTGYARDNDSHVKEWLSPIMRQHSEYVYDHIDGAVSALYEYHLSCLRHLTAEKVAYGGIPIDTQSVEFRPMAEDINCVNIMLACHKGREAEKGADLMLPVLRQLEHDNPGRVHLDLVQNVPFAEFQRIMDRAHVIVDQLYSYTPATTALMAMAAGKVVVSGAEPEYYDFIGEGQLRPIINPVPDNLESLRSQLQRVIDEPAQLAQLGRAGHEFVLRHNETEVVAQRFVNFWQRRIR